MPTTMTMTTTTATLDRSSPTTVSSSSSISAANFIGGHDDSHRHHQAEGSSFSERNNDNNDNNDAGSVTEFDDEEQQRQQQNRPPPRSSRRTTTNNNNARNSGDPSKRVEANNCCGTCVGRMTNREWAMVICWIVTLVVASIVVAVVLLYYGGSNDNNNTAAIPSVEDDSNTKIKTNATTTTAQRQQPRTPFHDHVSGGGPSPIVQYDYLRHQIGLNPVTAHYLGILPPDVRELSYDAEDDSLSLHPIIRAASWAVLLDATDTLELLVHRFALAALYFGNGGTHWNRLHEHWMTEESVCDWEGIWCRPFSGNNFETRILELDLAQSNLRGEIPAVFALFTEVQSIWLNGNQLSGTIPGEVFGSLPDLRILYLHDNQLTGTIPESLLGDDGTRGNTNGHLRSLFVDGNDLSGSWPEAFCASSSKTSCRMDSMDDDHTIDGDRSSCNDEGPFQFFRLDCDKTPCPEGCCLPENCA